MDEIQVMATDTSLALRISKREHVVFEEELCHAGVVAARGEAGSLDEQRRLHVAGNAGRSSLEELHSVL